MINNIPQAVAILQRGGVIAYPTEAVFGLGCDPMNEEAVKRLLRLKHRSVDKGLILIASSWEQVTAYAKPLTEAQWRRVSATWPGAVTWVFPATTMAPKWITGTHDSIALRVTAHPVANQLCRAFGRALVSTSANVEGEKPACSIEEVETIFSGQLDGIVEGEVGGLLRPTQMCDAVTGEVLRS